MMDILYVKEFIEQFCPNVLLQVPGKYILFLNCFLFILKSIIHHHTLVVSIWCPTHRIFLPVACTRQRASHEWCQQCKICPFDRTTVGPLAFRCMWNHPFRFAKYIFIFNFLTISFFFSNIFTFLNCMCSSSKQFMSIAQPKSINRIVGTCELGFGLLSEQKIKANQTKRVTSKKKLTFSLAKNCPALCRHE